MGKSKTPAQIEFVKRELAKGTPRANILTLFVQNWPKTSTRTFTRRLSIATDEYESEMAEKERIRKENMPAEVKAEIMANIATETELDLILSKIAYGDVTVEEYIKGIAVVRGVTPTEQIAAIDKLYKRKGSYATIKNETTLKGSLDASITIEYTE